MVFRKFQSFHEMPFLCWRLQIMRLELFSSPPKLPLNVFRRSVFACLFLDSDLSPGVDASLVILVNGAVH